MKKYIFMKNIMLLLISIFILFKYDKNTFLFLSNIALNVIFLFVFLFLCKKNNFLFLSKRYISSCAIYLIVGAVFLCVYYKNQSNDIGVLIMLLTSSDVAFLLYVFSYTYLYKKINHQKTNEIIKELKQDIRFNDISVNFYHYRLKNNYSDSNGYNPSSGLPMVNSGFDVGGNAYGSYHRQ